MFGLIGDRDMGDQYIDFVRSKLEATLAAGQGDLFAKAP
jgi:hypothetical protein